MSFYNPKINPPSTEQIRIFKRLKLDIDYFDEMSVISGPYDKIEVWFHKLTYAGKLTIRSKGRIFLGTFERLSIEQARRIIKIDNKFINFI